MVVTKDVFLSKTRCTTMADLVCEGNDVPRKLKDERYAALTHARPVVLARAAAL